MTKVNENGFLLGDILGNQNCVSRNTKCACTSLSVSFNTYLMLRSQVCHINNTTLLT